MTGIAAFVRAFAKALRSCHRPWLPVLSLDPVWQSRSAQRQFCRRETQSRNNACGACCVQCVLERHMFSTANAFGHLWENCGPSFQRFRKSNTIISHSVGLAVNYFSSYKFL